MFTLRQFRSMDLKSQLAFLIESGHDLETECRTGPLTCCLFYFNDFYAEIRYDSAGIPVKIHAFRKATRLEKYLGSVDISGLESLLYGSSKTTKKP